MVAGKFEFAAAVPLRIFCSLLPCTLLARTAQEMILMISTRKTITTATTMPKIAPKDKFMDEVDLVGVTNACVWK